VEAQGRKTIYRKSFTPPTLDVLSTPEVIPVLFKPMFLTFGLAGLPTLRLVAE
jgi:hypothetical protein